MICLAKGIASGMPLGAMIARAELMDWPPGSHASTFGGNPVCCRAALATLDLIEREYRANAAARGDQLATALELLAMEHRWLVDVRGLGLMRAIDVTQRRPARSGSPRPIDPSRVPSRAFALALRQSRHSLLPAALHHAGRNRRRHRRFCAKSSPPKRSQRARSAVISRIARDAEPPVCHWQAKSASAERRAGLLTHRWLALQRSLSRDLAECTIGPRCPTSSTSVTSRRPRFPVRENCLLACAPMRSNINLSHIVRIAGCAGIERLICCGHAKIVDKIARDGADTVQIEVHRTLPPVLRELKAAGYRLVGLEQTTGSQNLHDYPFERKTSSGDRQRAPRPDRRRTTPDRRRGGNPRLRPAARLQRRHARPRWPSTNIAASFRRVKLGTVIPVRRRL